MRAINWRKYATAKKLDDTCLNKLAVSASLLPSVISLVIVVIDWFVRMIESASCFFIELNGSYWSGFICLVHWRVHKVLTSELNAISPCEWVNAYRSTFCHEVLTTMKKWFFKSINDSFGFCTRLVGSPHSRRSSSPDIHIIAFEFI